MRFDAAGINTEIVCGKPGFSKHVCRIKHQSSNAGRCALLKTVENLDYRKPRKVTGSPYIHGGTPTLSKSKR